MPRHPAPLHNQTTKHVQTPCKRASAEPFPNPFSSTFPPIIITVTHRHRHRHRHLECHYPSVRVGQPCDHATTSRMRYIAPPALHACMLYPVLSCLVLSFSCALCWTKNGKREKERGGEKEELFKHRPDAPYVQFFFFFFFLRRLTWKLEWMRGRREEEMR
ncbi:hypothetical protein IWX46DRAFT_283099 [Phyllosticta citricarpa]|uniref:Uncharacterized protein n=1 Tax=Phyllosticta citricarpa TaxID=55181 RepID=A0ABR1MNZ2_9PEZI